MADHPLPPLPPLLQGIATSTPDHLHLHTVAHAVSLDELPLDSWIDLPITGALELDIDLRVPDVGGRLVVVDTRGTIAIRTTSRCRIGDDATPLKHPSLDGFFPGGIPFTHLDLDSLRAELTVADGQAQLTRFEVASPDLDLRLELTVTLVTWLLQSTVAGTLRFRLTDIFAQREPLIHGLLSLFNLSPDPAALASIPFTGTLRAPRRAAGRP